MIARPLKLSLLFAFCFLSAFAVQAQDLEQCAYVDEFPRKEPLPDSIRERMITLCIEARKKEFDELVKRSEEIAKLSKEIGDSFAENEQLSDADRDKLKEVEDLLKKVRDELRADDDDGGEEAEDEEPSSTMQAIQNLQENASKLLEEIKKTTRHTVSAAAIQSSNAVKKLIKFLRFGK
jgi:light-regulated signal transduction histidine kinase (bacteriophytochrome)